MEISQEDRILELEVECERELDRISDILSEDIKRLRRTAESWKCDKRAVRDAKIRAVEMEDED